MYSFYSRKTKKSCFVRIQKYEISKKKWRKKEKHSDILCISSILPRRGTASDVAGIVSATILRKTVRDNRIVTPEINKKLFEH